MNTMAKYMRIRDWLSFVPLVNVAAHLYLTPKVISLHQEVCFFILQNEKEREREERKELLMID